MKDERPLVYLSYRLHGSKQHAELLSQALGESGDVRVFADADIPPGSHWPSVLQEGLDQATALIVLIDEDWLRYQDEWGRRRIDNAEDWVHREVIYALKHDMLVLPVLVEDARMPPKRALPATLSDLAERQAARIRVDSLDEDLPMILSWAESLGEGPRLRGSTADFRDRGPKRVQSFDLFSTSQCRLSRLEIRGFRCIGHLELDFMRESVLDGDWTCIVGLNGAGKTSILQAIALLLMGPEYALELGRERLRAMRRQSGGKEEQSVLRAWIEYGGDEHYLEMAIDEHGPTGSSENLSDPRGSTLWRSLENLTIVGYGASRNLSDSPDRWEGTSAVSLAHISLFDPMARLVRTKEVLQREGKNALDLFAQLVGKVFGDEAIDVEKDGEIIRFRSADSVVRANDLADGFRSSVTWMAHFCARAAAVQPSAEKVEDLAGLVLVDEIDLHLHASLQRRIVPRLRETLPKVQFVVTSHSPLIISSFDRNELILLDRQKPDGVRHLDRQIFAFSPDEIYNWLMATPPHSAALDRKLSEGSDPDLAVLLYQSPNIDARQAKERDLRQKEILQGMGFKDGSEV